MPPVPLQSNPKEAQVTHSDIELDVDFDTHVLSGHVEVGAAGCRHFHWLRWGWVLGLGATAASPVFG